ncbi:CIC11C00000005343 [Sungouiella intermedia]|uniref:CIC11C00000001713 n=1 Tax=Sungouiella intermedia TaxID=45354 RepID=A0A1L0BR57_9ASCO|nr:CIC11C00000001713 [[Candida] intermedia]SGZ53833.1 CIC11C00000005343 [[Candida] intermedia]
MPISPAFLHSQPPNETQKLLLVLLAIFLAPLPFYLLTGPNYTIRTKEFLISFLLTLLVPFGGFLYALYFICVGLPQALAASGADGYIRVNGDLEHGETAVAGDDAEAPAAPKDSGSKDAAPKAAPQSLYRDTPDNLPSYEEVEGSSNGARAPVDSKFGGDNKVQV